MFQPHQLWMSTAGSSRQTIFVIVTSPKRDVSVTFWTAAMTLVETMRRITPVTSWRPMWQFRTPLRRSDDDIVEKLKFVTVVQMASLNDRSYPSTVDVETSFVAI